MDTVSMRLRLDGLATDRLEENPKSPPGSWRWLEDPEDAAELAALFKEAAPTLGVHNYPKLTPPRTPSEFPRWPSEPHASTLVKQRLQAAVPIPSGAGQVDWSRLTATIASELLAVEEDPPEELRYDDVRIMTKQAQNAILQTPGGSLVEVNSGGRVLFCMFELDETTVMQLEGPPVTATTTGAAAGSVLAPRREGCLVLKFVPSRLLCQSEQFASELARHVGICSPETRILKAASPDGEWSAAMAAAERIAGTNPELLDELKDCGSLLVMEYVPGNGLFRSQVAFQPSAALYTFLDLGRLFALDMLLGNSDRLRCEALGWRGNPENVLCATGGRWEGRLVAIDAVVQRRPPGALLSAEDAACERILELMLNDQEVAETVVKEAVGACPAAANAVDNDPSGTLAAFQNGLRQGLDATMRLKGLLEMMFEVVTEWIGEFIEDIEGIGSPKHATRRVNSASATPSAANAAAAAAASAAMLQSPEVTKMTTFMIRRINMEATHNRSVGEKVTEWKSVFRARGEDLRAAVEEWQAKRGGSTAVGEGSGNASSGVSVDGRDWGSTGTASSTNSINGDDGSGTSKDNNTHNNNNNVGSTSTGEVLTPRSAAISSGMKLTTGFLEGTHPVVDVYELKVRLEHMLQRLRVLQQAMATAPPTCLLPGLYLSGAVEASSLHLLRYYGITHVLNATEDLLLPEETDSFTGMRIPLRDVEEEEITPYFSHASSFIDSALSSGGGVLVHCHAGRSRSCSLVLAWLITRRRWSLKKAMEFLLEKRPQAAPNAGYLQQLSALEAELLGTQTLKVKKTKPEPKKCPECGHSIGLSAESVRVHIKLKHPSKAHAYVIASHHGSLPGSSDNSPKCAAGERNNKEEERMKDQDHGKESSGVEFDETWLSKQESAVIEF